MQTESFDGGRSLVLEALAADGALKQMTGQREIPPTDSDEDSAPPLAAMYGLAMAIPLSILLWAMVGVMLWLWTRRG